VNTPIEGAILLAACRHEPGGPQLHNRPDHIDWNRVLNLARIHALTPSLARGLSPLGLDVPESIDHELHARTAAIAARNLRRVSELLTVTDLLKDAGVNAVPFKGPVLALQAYGNLASREFVDLDLLVPTSHVRAAAQVLGTAGYRMEPSLRDDVLQRLLRTDHEVLFVGPDGGLLELQWGLAARYFVMNPEAESMMRRAVSVEVGGRQLSVLTAEDLVLMLAIHAGKHLWERAAWVVDLDRVVRSMPSIDWSIVRERARRAHALRMARLSIAIAWRALAPTWVPHVSAALGRDPAADDIATRLVAAWFLPGERASRDEPSSTERDLFRLHDNGRDALRHLWRLAVTPSEADLGAIHLPQGFGWGYVPLRFGRLVTTRIRRG